MLFNSFQFLVFYVVVLAAYFAMPQRRRWMLLLVASYVFYMSWRPEYVLLIVASTSINYWVGIGLERTTATGQRRALLSVGVCASLSLLVVYKYLDFFSESFESLLSIFGVARDLPELDLILPLGISFYTFQALGYTVDVYRRVVPAERHFGIFALYVSFFPQLVAGPIERSGNLLPQFRKQHEFDPARVTEGLQLILWGLFKKVLIADQLSVVVDKVYGEPELFGGPYLLLATIFFSVQIYCDFSGYSDMAIGTAKIMGYDLMTNFSRPYFATSISEFWRRWHISLSTWFRDYVYLPLGGNRVRQALWVRNIMIVFLVSGVWHGASWTFVVWGGIHGVCMVLSSVTAPLRRRVVDGLGVASWPGLLGFVRILLVFAIVMVAWTFFRAQSVSEAASIISRFGDWGGFQIADLWSLGLPRFEMMVAFAGIALLFVVEGCQEYAPPAIRRLWSHRPFRWACYAAEFYGIAFFGVFGHVEFIYFQF